MSEVGVALARLAEIGGYGQNYGQQFDNTEYHNYDAKISSTRTLSARRGFIALGFDSDELDVVQA